MVKHTREQVVPILDTVGTASCKRFQRQLSEILYPPSGSEYLLASETVDSILRALEESALKWIADAVDAVSAVSKAPEAFALINEALAAYMSELQRKAETVIQIATKTTIKLIDGNRLGGIRQRIERVFDGYRETFTGEDKAHLKPVKSPAELKPFTDAERKEWIKRQPRQIADAAYKKFKLHPRYDGTKQAEFRQEWKSAHNTQRARPKKS